MEARKQKFTIGYFVAALLALFLVQALVLAPHVENLSYSEFKSLVAKDKVSNLVIGKQVITGALAANGLEGLLPNEKLDELKRYGGGDVLLGGRVAEELIFGDVSTGASDDLRRATDIARHMITQYGMSEMLGLATFEAPRQALFLPVPSGQPKEYSERTAEVIDAEIQQMLNAAHERVRAALVQLIAETEPATSG